MFMKVGFTFERESSERRGKPGGRRPCCCCPGWTVVMSTLGTGAGDLEPSAVAGGLVPEHTFAEILLDSTAGSYYKIGNPAILPACLS